VKRSTLLRRLKRTPITISLAPLLAPYHRDVNPRIHDHCGCCVRNFGPADCPLTHLTACPECQADAGSADLLGALVVMAVLFLLLWMASAVGYLLTGVEG
jgi:hypothetical protein